MGNGPGLKIELYRQMLRIRLVEEMLAELYKEQEMRTPTHFAIGQEAVAAGVCAALAQEDIVYNAHRSHAHYLAKGGSLDGLVAELYGKESGTSRGRGGSVHLTARETGFVVSTAIVGQTMAVAAGAALAFAMDGEPRVAVCFFGDGAVDEGVFSESLNFASVRQLPVIFVCENNLYSTHTLMSTRQPPGTKIYERAAAFSMASEQVDGYEPLAVYAAARGARERCLRGDGPAFIECLTYRWREHVGPYEDWDTGYRSKEELDAWRARDPLKRLGKELVADGACAGEELEAWADEVRAEVDASVARAQASAFPDVAGLLENVY